MSSGTVVVVCESQSGRASSVTDAARDMIKGRGFEATVGVMEDVAASTIAAADALIAGCWMPGKAPFEDEPVQRMATCIDSLEPLHGKPVGIFCMYRFFPHTFADTATRTAETEHLLADRFERKGGRIAAKRSIHVNSIEEDTAALVESVLEHVAAV